MEPIAPAPPPLQDDTGDETLEELETTLLLDFCEMLEEDKGLLDEDVSFFTLDEEISCFLLLLDAVFFVAEELSVFSFSRFSHLRSIQAKTADSSTTQTEFPSFLERHAGKSSSVSTESRISWSNSQRPLSQTYAFLSPRTSAISPERFLLQLGSSPIDSTCKLKSFAL